MSALQSDDSDGVLLTTPLLYQLIKTFRPSGRFDQKLVDRPSTLWSTECPSTNHPVDQLSVD